MTFKTIAFVAVLASAVAMGACGKKDSLNAGGKDATVVGSCTYNFKQENNTSVSICEQVYFPSTVTSEQTSKASDTMKANCAGQTDSKFSSNGCSADNAVGACKIATANGVTNVEVIYKGGVITTDNVKAYCQQGGKEFFQP